MKKLFTLLLSAILLSGCMAANEPATPTTTSHREQAATREIERLKRELAASEWERPLNDKPVQ